MLFQSSGKDVNVRIEVSGGNFEGELGEERRKTFQCIVQFCVAVGISKPAQLTILADELASALIRCLSRLKGIEKDQKDFLKGIQTGEIQDSIEGCGDGGEEGEEGTQGHAGAPQGV